MLENSWVVGIGGGIISGLIVYFVTNWFFVRKDKGERIKLTHQANEEVVNTLKPYIADKGLPEKLVVSSLISSVSRKYKVETSEMYSIEVVCEELIREIISNVYVSCDKKEEFTKQLARYVENIKKEKESKRYYEMTDELLSRKYSQDTYRAKLNSRFSLLLAMYVSLTMAVMLIAVGYFGNTSEEPQMFESLSQNEQILLLFFLIIMTTVAFGTAYRILIDVRNRNRQQKMRNEMAHKIDSIGKASGPESK